MSKKIALALIAVAAVTAACQRQQPQVAVDPYAQPAPAPVTQEPVYSGKF